MSRAAPGVHARLAEDLLVTGSSADLARVRHLVAARDPELAALKPWKVTKAGLHLPRGMLAAVQGLRELPVHVVDKRTRVGAFKGAGTTQLRPYQRVALQAWLRNDRNGVVVAPCGSGKTQIGLAAAEATGHATLVLVHTLDLVEQWRERAEREFGRGNVAVHRGALDAPATPTKRITIATVQGLAHATPAALVRWGARFGLVVLDEAHHAPARTFAKVVGSMTAHARLALTATPERADERTPLLAAHFGPIASTIPVHRLEAVGATLAPLIVYHPTGWSPQPGMRADEDVDDPRRNELVAQLVRAQVGTGGRVLVLVRRVHHAEAIGAELRRRRVSHAVITGDVPIDERRRRLAAMREGKIQVLVGTSLADEGLDLPEINTVVLAAPSALVGRVQQRIGRALRPLEGKRPPRVLDLVDAHPAAVKAAKARDAMYVRLRWRVTAVRGPLL